MAAIDSFDDVRGLDEPALRALLDGGRPEERVWAIWALALRSCAPLPQDISHHADPDPGVRRNLAVVLAGHGEHELLVALAVRDPAPEVRAAAMQLVTRLAIDGHMPPDLVTDRVRGEAAAVKVAVLSTVFAGAPEWLAELARRLLDDRDGDVRYEAFEALVRIGDHGVALMWLEELGESEARLTIMRFAAGPGACAELLARSSRRLRRLLVDTVRVPSWHDLAPAIGDDPQLMRALLHRDATQLDRIALAPLIRATLADERGGWLGGIRARLAGLEHASDDVAPLLPALHELCSRRLAELKRELVRFRPRGGRASRADDEDVVFELEDARVAVEATLDEVSRLLVH